MKILFLCPSLVGAGVERRVCTLFNELLRLDIDVHLALLRYQGEFLSEVPKNRLRFIPPDARRHRLLSRMLPSRDLVQGLIGISQIRQLLAKCQPDLVFSFTLETTIPMVFNRFAACGKPFTWIISEDSNTAVAVRTCAPPIMNGMLRCLLAWVYRQADHVNCVSDAVAKSLCSGYGIHPERVSILSNPVDLERISTAILSPTPINIPTNFVLAVGRLVKVKQFELLIRAFAKVRKTCPIQLLILGEGPERVQLVREISDLGLEQDVLLPGFIDNPWIFMARAKMLVLSSKLEGFGNVIVEAMAAGCPVVATRCGGPEDIIEDDRNGILVDQNEDAIAQAIQSLLTDSEKARRLAHHALADASNYKADRIAAKLLSILNRLGCEQGLLNPIHSQGFPLDKAASGYSKRPDNN